MPDKHEPDPQFLDRLEWQLKGELRRQNRSGAPDRLSTRILKIAALMVVSVGLGAGAMGASQQLQESWRAELLEARLEVQLEMAQQRLQMQRETLEHTRGEVEQGIRTARDLMYAELQIAQAQSEAAITQLEFEEIRESGREPLGELSSPLVGDRDFVSEKIQIRMHVASLHRNTIRSELERERSMMEAGLVGSRDVQGRNLSLREAELQLDGLARRLDVRQAYLNADISAVEAELQVLELEVQNRMVLLNEQRQFFQSQFERMQEMADEGTVGASDLSGMEMQIAEIEGQLRMAETEFGIVQRELARRAGSR